MSSGGVHHAPPHAAQTQQQTSSRLQFVMGGVLLLGAAILLIASSTVNGAQYYVTVEQLLQEPRYIGEDIRLSGVVLGETIAYDSRNLIIEFQIVNLPRKVDNLAIAVHEAVTTPQTPRLLVRVEGEVMPNLLQHGAQAILTGRLGQDGIFHATELLLKCPTRVEETILDAHFIPHELEQSHIPSENPSTQ
jgi:cytochrome c-type biogenesis protein CcmE